MGDDNRGLTFVTEVPEGQSSGLKKVFEEIMAY